MTALLGFFALLDGFVKDLRDMSHDPRYRGLVVWLCTLLVVGVIFYHQVEGWSWIDSYYFTVISLATIGYGDLSPTTSVSKLFTTAYAVLGLTTFAGFLKILTQERRQRISQRRKHIVPDVETEAESTSITEEQDPS
jgi:voltage-gated potassium channel